MGLLKPKNERRKLIRTYTTMHCRVARNSVGWCRALCTPVDGMGPCGRVAPHGIVGKHQQAILDSDWQP